MLALEEDILLSEAWNNVGVTYHTLGIYASREKEFERLGFC